MAYMALRVSEAGVAYMALRVSEVRVSWAQDEG